MSSLSSRLKRDLSFDIQKPVIFNYDESLQEKIRKHKLYAEKLRIFGENYLIKPSKSKSNQSRNYETIE